MSSTLPLRRAALAAAALASVFLLSACAPSTSPKEDYAGEPVIEHEVEEDEEGAGATEEEEAEEEAPEEEPEEEPEQGGEGQPTAVWLAQGGQLAVTVWGSSGCPPVGTKIEVVDPAGEGNTVSVSVKKIEDYGSEASCTQDMVPHTTVFWTPMNVATTEPLLVRVDGSEVEVPVK